MAMNREHLNETHQGTQLAERTPRCDIDAERAVLGAMLLGGDEGLGAIEAGIAAGLRYEHFYREAHSVIYKGIRKLHHGNQPMGLLTLTRELERTGYLKKVGGVRYINGMMDAVPSAANVQYYVDMVLEDARVRVLAQITRAFHAKTFEASTESQELLAELQDAINSNALVQSAGGRITAARDDWPHLMERLDESQRSEFLGLRTGFPALDRVTLGLRGLSVLGGLPGQGKSSFSLQLAAQIAEINHVPCLFYALEMSKWDLYTKIMSRLSTLDYVTLTIGSLKNGRRGNGLTDEDYQKLEAATGKFMKYGDRIWIIDRTVCRDISLNTVRLHIQRARREFAASEVFLVIDHLQLFPVAGVDDSKQRLDFLMTEFKAISEQLNASILLISEKNRQSYEKDWLGAFMGSGGIEYGADLAMLFHEESDDNGRGPIDDSQDGEKEMELRICKNRFGSTAKIKMRFCPEVSEFIEV